MCGTNQVELSIEDNALYTRIWKQLAYNVRGGQPVTVESNGTTYTFCKVDYIYG